MMAERCRYDKIWIEGCTYEMKVGDLKAKVEAALGTSGLELTAIMAPKYKYKSEPDPESENPEEKKGIFTGAGVMYNSMMDCTQGTLLQPLVEVVLQSTSSREDGLPIISPPVDLRQRRLYDGLTIILSDDDGDQVDTAAVILKFVAFDFVPFLQRPAFIDRAGASWL
eukprot:TRINITY_DN7677_c0_g1_i1.p1 TRINITY_DN7677_c0_g1~~TRINITY_DN7677_c0_g1_i1.p1  ORF type:complete len:168 (+),score=40.34 TRINITY_DN7677_c0_g1_i1:85-588(+)